MLDNKDWKSIAPEVPQEFHARFEETIQNIQVTKRPKGKISFRILAVAAALCALCTATVAANEIFKWSDALIERYQPTEEQQQKLADSGNIQGIGQSVTQNEVTITLEQALLDSKRIYMLFTVETPENIKLDNTAGFVNGLNLTLDGEDFLSALDGEYMGTSGGGSGGFVSEKDMEGQTEHKRYYEISYNVYKGIDFSGKKIGVVLEDLTMGGEKAMPGEVVAEGRWEFTWETGDIEKGEMFKINKTYNLGGYDVLIKSIELTPLSYTICADLKDVRKIEEDERNTFTYNGDDPGLTPDQRLTVTAVEYQDGRKIELNPMGGGGTSVDEPEQSYINYDSFDAVIDIDKVQAVYIMQGEVKIPDIH